MKDKIFLIGFMGTGKTTVLKELEELLGQTGIDSDWAIEKETGRKISDIFQKEGETYFRDLETEFLRKLEEEEVGIISCGGGMALRKDNVKLMKNQGLVVWLTADATTILERVRKDESRPLLQGKKTVEDIQLLMDVRREYYEFACDLEIKTDGKSGREIAEEIIKRKRERF